MGDALEDVVTPDEPINVPGLTSGKSIQKSGVETVTSMDRGDDAHHRPNTICWRSSRSRSVVGCDYSAVERKIGNIP